MASGACRERPDVNFFPVQGQTAAPAKAICRECPTRARCLEYALETAADGVWGGTSTKERRAMLRL